MSSQPTNLDEAAPVPAGGPPGVSAQPPVDLLEDDVHDDVRALRRAMDRASTKTNPTQRAIAYEVVGARASAGQQAAVADRNQVAAYLHHTLDWPLSRIERVLNARSDMPALRQAIEDTPNPPGFTDPEGTLTALIKRSRDLHGVWAESVRAAAAARVEAANRPRPVLDLPSDPDLRMEKIAMHLAEIKAELAVVVRDRNEAGAGLVRHWNWPVASVARICAGDEIHDIAGRRSFSGGRARMLRELEVDDAPNLDRRLVQAAERAAVLTDLRDALEEARTETVRRSRRHLTSSVEDDLVDLPSLRKAVNKALSTGDAEQKAKVLAHLRSLRRDVREELRPVAVTLHVLYGVPLAELQRIMVPTSRRQGSLKKWVDETGVPPKMSKDEAWDLFRRRAQESAALLELRRQLLGSDDEAA